MTLRKLILCAYQEHQMLKYFVSCYPFTCFIIKQMEDMQIYIINNTGIDNLTIN